MSEVERAPCSICDRPEVARAYQVMRDAGKGAQPIWRALRETFGDVSKHTAEQHAGHVERTVMSAVAEAVDVGTEVDDGYLGRHGVDVPDDVRWVAATVETVNEQGERSWLRVKPPEDVDAERIEIRQAEPVEVNGEWPHPAWDDRDKTPGAWQTWIASPDAQIGYWYDEPNDRWTAIHDERAFNLGHQIAAYVAEHDGLHGWIDPGDFLDLAAPSRHHPTATDLHAKGLSMAFQRGCEEFARRRWVVGEEGEVVLLEGNHDLRLKSNASQNAPWLVGVRRAGDPVDEHPVLSVPYMTRARDYGVRWVAGFPTTYWRLNGNLSVFHSPAYGSKALDTARKIAAKVHMSVYHGHTHRREALAENIETKHGVRTMEVWSDGTWARIDGALPSARNAYDDSMVRMLAPADEGKVGRLSENMHQGMSVITVETGGAERFGVERVAFWGSFAMFRGIRFEATCDIEGRLLDAAS